MNNNSARHREIACATIDELGRFLLQQRDDMVGIIHPGMVGLAAIALECVVREIHA
jgi:hypothetical protein